MNKSSERKIDQVLELVIEASSEALERRLAKRERRRADIKQYALELMQNLKQVEQKAQTLVKEAAAQVSKTALRIHEHAHEKPWYYIASAALGGLILGALLRARR